MSDFTHNVETYEEEIESIIELLTKQFDPLDIEDYEAIVALIYNDLFLGENYVDSRKKYLLFNLLSKAMERIESSKNITNDKIINARNKQDYLDFLYDTTVSSHIKNGLRLFLRKPRVQQREKC